MWVWLFLFQVSLAAHVCPPPAVPVNCQVEVTEEAATYKCDEGYTLFGSATRKCNPEDGIWRGKLPVCGTNIAYLRPANQSSTLGNAGASLANDGRATHHHEGSQCAVTTTQVSPWWRVDLLQNYEVVVVVVHTRACCDSPPLQNLEIRVGDSLDIQKNRLCAWEPGNVEQGARVEFVCALPLRGQFVILQTTGRESELSLCEVEVYSTEEFAKERCSTTADIATVGVFNKTCYQFNVKEGASFDNARELCKASASTGDLAHAISPVTHHYLTSELEGRKDALKSELVWVGARRDPGFISRTWRWVDGTVVEETKWGRGQPNNYNGKQDCVALDRGRKWLWNDVGCELDYLPYICMHSPGSCGSPDSKVNTTLQVTSGQTRSQAVYSCPVGSKLVGDSTRYCLQSGFWNGSAPSCKYIDCGVPQQITNGNYTYNGGDERNTYMARITYTCAQNYSLGGAHERVCTEEGVWAPEEPACLYARCPALPTPPHATIQADSNSHSAGGTITYICDDGYVLQGNKTVSCQLGGHWSGQPPSCAFTDCGLPHDLQNGQAVLLNQTTTYGSQVAYKCAPNFWLSGTELRTCGTEGQWSGTEPECLLITCGEPEVPPGGYVTGYSFQVGSEVRYRCDEGHRLDVVGASGLERAGQLEREKEDDFNGDLERERVRKREISEAEKGAVYLRECTQDGVWSGVVPECVYIDCGRVQAVPKASITYRDGKTHMHARLTYTCAHGFRLRGNAQRQCSEDGTWSGSDPVCEEVRCPAPPTKEAESSAFLKLISGNDRRLPSAYGRRRGRGRGREREGESYRVGSVATYECPKGYVINTTTAATPTTATTTTTTTTITTAASTAALLTCTTNGTWSGPVPACSYVDCGLPEKIQNGYYRLLSNTTHFASLVAYECVPNYKVSGRIRRNCLANGTWAGLSPSCEEIRCHNLTHSLPAGLSVAADSLIVTSTARYYCEKGRRIVGNSQRTCNSNGLWNGSQPRCEWVTCQLPQPLKNGRVVRLNETLNYGTIIEYHCLPDYQLFGLFSRTCDEKGSWSGAEPVCVGKDEEYLHENSIGDSSSSTGTTTTTTTTATNTGLYTGLIVGLLLIIVFISGLVYLRRRQKAAAAAEEDEAKVRGDRPPLPPPNKTPTITYSNLTDPMTGNNIYENIDEQEEEEEEEGRGGRGGMPIYINNNNYQDAATTTTTTTATAATTGPLASINRPTMSTRRPRLPPPQPPTVPSGVTINGVTISETV